MVMNNNKGNISNEYNKGGLMMVKASNINGLKF